jgi:hypothetical protein
MGVAIKDLANAVHTSGFVVTRPEAPVDMFDCVNAETVDLGGISIVSLNGEDDAHSSSWKPKTQPSCTTYSGRLLFRYRDQVVRQSYHRASSFARWFGCCNR